jgi:hypothetical protein
VPISETEMIKEPLPDTQQVFSSGTIELEKVTETIVPSMLPVIEERPSSNEQTQTM